MSKLPTQSWNKAKISPDIPLKTPLSKRENHSTNDAFWLVESRDAHSLLLKGITLTTISKKKQNNNEVRKKILPFVTTYHPALPNLKNILMSKWHLIQDQPEMFRKRDIRRNVLPKLGAHLDELQHGGRKPTEASVTEFCYNSVNLFFEKLINN